MKLLDCMEIKLANAETSFQDISRKYQGSDQINYKQALQLIIHDTDNNSWFARK